MKILTRKMKKLKTIIFDLDGTLINTTDAQFADYRDGKALASIDKIPLFKGAVETIEKLKDSGHQVFIASDSHPKFVRPIAEKIFKVKSLSLANKPTVEKISEFINNNSTIKLPSSRIFLIGDSFLDIQTARKLKIPSVQICHEENFCPEVWSYTQKTGPTFSLNGFKDLVALINDPSQYFLWIEGLKFNLTSKGFIKIDGIDYRSNVGRKRHQISLSRMQNGQCDIFECDHWYRQFGDIKRTKSLMQNLTKSCSLFLEHFQFFNKIYFDVLSWVPDKHTTIPKRKMEDFVSLIESPIPKASLLNWNSNVEGSIRKQPHRKERFDFVKQFMSIDKTDVLGKNVIIIDDQLTTGATMDAVTDILWESGANHILFLTLFRLISEIPSGVFCQNCGKEMSLKTRRTDAKKFYSCIPQKYGGVGCGKILNLD